MDRIDNIVGLEKEHNIWLVLLSYIWLVAFCVKNTDPFQGCTRNSDYVRLQGHRKWFQYIVLIYTVTILRDADGYILSHLNGLRWMYSKPFLGLE